MASTFVASRIQLIYALCLPLAVLLGYFVSDPTDPSSLLMVFLVVGVLSIPLFMRWHHPLLILTWNAAFAPFFIPGQPFLWMPLAFIALLFGLLNRFTDPDVKFVMAPSLMKPLLFLTLVIIVTAWFRGGIMLQSMGSERYGGKAYLYVLAAIAGYFALTSQRLPQNRVHFFVGAFFLTGLTALLPNLAYYSGRSFDFVFYVMPAVYALEQAKGDYLLNPDFTRVYGLGLAAIGFFCYLQAMYGLRGVFDWTKPWRALLLVLAVVGCLFSGFRGELIFFAVALALQMYFERLFRPKILIICGTILIVSAGVLIPNARKLPMVVQRTISFLPVEVSIAAEMSAAGSTEWRKQMWFEVLPMVPRYLFLGKGYALDPTEVAFSQENARRGFGGPYGSSLAAGDYHNGPLTLLVPLGIWGAVGFVWFVVAGFKQLYRCRRDGDPALRSINTFLLVYFVARLVVYLLVFGSFYNDLFMFTGVVGLSVSINGAMEAKKAEEEVEAESDPEELALEARR